MQYLTQFTKSKKFVALILGMLLIMLADYLGVSTEAIISMTGLLSAFEVGQGIADHGKEKAKVEHVMKGKFSSEVEKGKV